MAKGSKKKKGAAGGRGVSTDSRPSKDPKGRNNSVSGVCGHLGKALNHTAVKKTLAKAIKANPQFPACNGCKTDSPASAPEEAAPSAWVCVQCGHQGCGRQSDAKHAVKHFEKPLTGSHAIAVHVPSFDVWCYACDDDVPEEQIQGSGIPALIKDLLKPLLRQHGMGSEAEVEEKKEEKKPKEKAAKEQPSDIVDVRVKGLSNLGNTCFFNSVTQCLMQTHQLRHVMDGVERSEGAELTLEPPPLPRPSPATPGPPSEGKDKAEKRDEADTTVLEVLDPISVLQGTPGHVTCAMSKLYNDFHDLKTSSVINPRSLFSSLTAKAVRFRGYAQQDAHELLRYFVDLLKAEETQRLQAAICEKLEMPVPPLPFTPAWAGQSVKLTPAQAATLQAYHSVGPYPMVEEVFGGSWIQSIRCSVCKHVSQIVEPLLDVTLPINAQILKASAKHGGSVDDEDLETLLEKKEKGLSKNQMKKLRKEQRRPSKKKTPKKTIEEPPLATEEDVAAEDEDGTVELATEAAELGSDGEAEVSEPESDYGSGGSSDSDPSEATAAYREEQARFRSRMVRLGSLGEASGNVMALLAAFTAPETLAGRNKFGCENCARLGHSDSQELGKKPSLLSSLKKKIAGSDGSSSMEESSGSDDSKSKKPKVVYVEAEKNYILFAPPAVLTIHLKRFHQVFRGFSKLNTPITFPLLMDMAPFTSAAGEGIRPGQTRVLYSLFGVVVHSGGMGGGHYIAFVKRRPLSPALQTAFLRRNPLGGPDDAASQPEAPDGPIVPPKGQWYEISDSSAKPTTEDRVLHAQAYVLFYERIQ